jgi:predicted aspartyl protease
MYEHVIGYKKDGDQTMGRFSVDLEVANYGDVLEARKDKLAPGKVRKLSLSGLVDPGASRLVLPEKVATELGLPVTGKVKVRYADGRGGRRQEVEAAYVTLLGRSGHFKAILEPRRDTALIGVIVLEDLDFVVDCTNQRLLPRDPKFIVSEIE